MATPPPPAPSFEVIADLALERLSLQAQASFDSAYRIATDRRDAYTGSEHLLLGVLGQPESIGGLALQSIGVTKDTVQERLEETLGRRGTGKGSSAVMTTRTMNAVLEAIGSAGDLQVVDTGVLVEGVIHAEGIGALILRDAGITVERWAAARRAIGADHQESASGGPSAGTAGLFIHRGYARLMIERPDDARADFATALESAATEHQTAIAANNLAWTDLYLGDRSRFPEALELADRAVRNLPNATNIQGTRAYALIENGRTQEGLDQLVAIGVQAGDDHATGNRACCLAVGLARVGDRAYAEVLLEVANHLRPGARLMARARQELAESTGPAKAAAAVPAGAVMTSVHSIRRHPATGKHVVILEGTDRRKFPIWIDERHAERLIRLIKTPTEPLPGRSEWIELLLTGLQSRGERITAVFLDRVVDEQFRGAALVGGNSDWSFPVRPADAGVIALLSRLPIAIEPGLWKQYSLVDPSTQGPVRRWLGAIVRER
jgi:bifunctional DNase/RNase